MCTRRFQNFLLVPQFHDGNMMSLFLILVRLLALASQNSTRCWREQQIAPKISDSSNFPNLCQLQAIPTSRHNLYSSLQSLFFFYEQSSIFHISAPSLCYNGPDLTSTSAFSHHIMKWLPAKSIFPVLDSFRFLVLFLQNCPPTNSTTFSSRIHSRVLHFDC